jgi:hypothetical protein
MRWPKFLRRAPAAPTGPLVVTFSGGMGAQIISAGIYFAKRQAGEPVYADLSYFDRPERVATVGQPGDCSQWAWQLAPFDLLPEAFEMAPPGVLAQALVLHDGPRKMQLGLEALSQPAVQQHFALPVGDPEGLPAAFEDGYLCIHIRRGDYVNVASHLVPEAEFVRIAAKFAGLTPHVAVLSDSPISPDLRTAIAAYYQRAAFLDNTDAFTAHRIMRGARILVCSNSQFSLIAAMLNSKALVAIPRQWFDGDERAIEAPLHARCTFQILSF